MFLVLLPRCITVKIKHHKIYGCYKYTEMKLTCTMCIALTLSSVGNVAIHMNPVYCKLL